MRSCAVHDTIFSTGGNLQPVTNFTELHALTQAARFYALLVKFITLLAVRTDIWYQASYWGHFRPSST